MDSALAARSTASSFHLTAHPRVWREPPGCYQPSRSKFTLSEPGQDDVSKACPPKQHYGRDRVFEVRTKLAHVIKYANSGRFPVCAGPIKGLSVRLCEPSAPAVLDRSAVRCRNDLARHTHNSVGASSSQRSQQGFQKE